ncbi:MAG: choice-of-anchor Q domain-containing protein [Anaerolineae bacterium]
MKQVLGVILVAFMSPLLLLSWLWTSSVAQAAPTATFTVCASGCDYATISSAVDDVPEGSLIDVQAGTFNENVLIEQSLSIQGQGIGVTVVDGQNSGSVFEIDTGLEVTLQDMTLQNGLSVSGGGGIYNDGTLTATNLLIQNNTAHCADGGGILNWDQITMQDVELTNNAANFGGAFSNARDALVTAERITVTQNDAVRCIDVLGEGGGIENNGVFSLADSLVQQNSADGDGGGIVNGQILTVTLSTIADNSAAGQGGGLDNIYDLGVAATATIIDSTIQGNPAVSGGGVNNAGEIQLLTSLVHSNSAGSGPGGGIHNMNDTGQAGLIYITNSTISGNQAGQGGGIHDEGSGTTAVIRSSTIVDNSSSAGSGGNLFNDTGTITLASTIIALPGAGNDCAGPGIVSNGANLDSDNSCGLGAGDLPGFSSPLLTPLRDNGGPTWTYGLLVGSPAIDAAPSAGCTAVPVSGVDQRGQSRNIDGLDDGDFGTECDIGALELQSPTAVTLTELHVSGTGEMSLAVGTFGVLALLTGGWAAHNRRRFRR